MNTASPEWSSTLLDDLQYQADPLADATMARVLQRSQRRPASTAFEALLDPGDPQWRRLADVSRLIEQWSDNRTIAAWRADDASAEPDVAEALQAYLREAQVLPSWADLAKLRRAEEIFTQHSVLSCTLLFCASLPECYVIPSLAEVLQTTGQLEQHTEYRIRATAAMIFPVMMPGGLTDPDGAGRAQVLKVRLIHASIRHLILRGTPEDALLRLSARAGAGDAGVVPRLVPDEPPRSMHQAFFAQGWNIAQDGLPCNQAELAYTLLTFGYVFLRGLRTLGMGLGREDELAYLHAWNVVGHVLGIQRASMADSMEQAQAMFARMQARGRAAMRAPDPRPELARALIHTMQHAIPLRAAKPLPLLLARRLCGPAAARDLGLTARVPVWSQLLFSAVMWVLRGVDALVRTAMRDFSVARFVVRVLAYYFITRVLMDQTRPLKLPQPVLQRVEGLTCGWGRDPKAPRWLNALENRFTARRKP